MAPLRGKESIYGELDEEVKLMKDHPHDHIVQFFDTVEDRLLIMEYCERGLLYDVLRGRSDFLLTKDETRQVLHQCLRAVAHLHDMNVSHRDLSPGNILFRTVSPVNIAVADFGWAKETSNSMMGSLRAGTPLYRAPELFSGRQGYRRSIDIWALGAIAMQCLLGLPDGSESGGSEQENAKAIIKHAEEHIKQAPEDPFIQLIHRMLSRDPNARPSAQDCLREVLSLPGFVPYPRRELSSAPKGATSGAASPGSSSGDAIARPSSSLCSGPPSSLRTLISREFAGSQFASSETSRGAESSRPITAVRASLGPAALDMPASSYEHDDKVPALAPGSSFLSPPPYPMSRNHQVSTPALHTTSGPVTSRKRPAEDTTSSSDGTTSEKPDSKRRAVSRLR